MRKILFPFLVFLLFFNSINLFAQGSSPVISDSADEGISVEVADAEDKNRDKGKLPPVIAPPHFARNKQVMPEFLLRHKEEDTVVTGFPAIGWDPDTGFNIGAALQIYNNGKKDSPFFRITPYRQSYAIMAVFSTRKNIQINAFYDNIYVKDSPWRVRSELDLNYNPFKNYFGIGSDGQNLIFPGTGRIFGSYNQYKDALKVQAGGRTNERYDVYRSTKMLMRASAEYDLFGGWIRPLMGFQLGSYWVGDYTGDVVKGAVQNSTHLSADCNSGRAKGCKGGRDFFVKLGVTLDTRNFEPNPSQGLMWEITSELSPKFLGSSFDYGRLNTDLRAFGHIFDYGVQRLTIAGRFFYQWQFGKIPFYSMNTLAYTDMDRTGLGGFSSIRGFRMDRFIAPVYMLTNFELRYRFYQFEIWNQNIQLGAKPFIDMGRSFDNVRQTSLKDWKIGGGGGLMLVWNLSTVINFDAAWCGEGSAFYMEAGTQF